MKKSSLLILILAAFSLSIQAVNKSDLIRLNSYWQDHSLDQNYLDQLNASGKYTPIQIHLLLVEKELRNKQENCKRIELINELHEYALAGNFPINNHHNKRIPYFIDDFGTACAVGQLIIKSGHQDLAHRISKESNYLYLREMNYPEIGLWADEFGFTIAELMWIQPSYGPSCAIGTKRDACYNSTCGCINPDFSSITGLASVISQYNDGSGWVVDSAHMWYNWDCARIGQHRIVAMDSLGVTYVFTYQVGMKPQINPAIVNIDPSTNNCDGSITASSNPSLGYSYYLRLLNNTYSSSNTTGVFNNLCSGAYQLIVSDSDQYCTRYYNLNLGISTSIDELNEQDLSTYPNPFTNTLQVDLLGEAIVRLYNISGKIMYEENHYNTALINTAGLNNGVFILEVSNSIGTLRKKIIKSN